MSDTKLKRKRKTELFLSLMHEERETGEKEVKRNINIKSKGTEWPFYNITQDRIYIKANWQTKTNKQINRPVHK